jgi:hypothetical protein
MELHPNCRICETHSKAINDFKTPYNIRNLAIANLHRHLKAKNPNLKPTIDSKQHTINITP